MTDSYRSSQEASGSSEVTGGGIGDVVVPAQHVVGGKRHWAGRGAAHDTMGTASLVYDTRMSPWADHIGTGLLALSIVHDLQVRLSATFVCNQLTFILVRVPIRATYGNITIETRTVRCAFTLGAAILQKTRLTRWALHTITAVSARLTIDQS